jgi:hypothetical protein
MINEFKKSIQLVFNERITSPFSGAFLFSWFLWNWKIPYILFFAEDELKVVQRLEIIHIHYINIQYNLVFPIISAIFLIVLYPFITTGAFWIWLKFKKWQTDLKNNIEGQTLLTLDQSIALRLEINSQFQKLDQLTKSKDDEILILRKENELLKNNVNSKDRSLVSSGIDDQNNYSNEVQEFLNNNKVIEQFPRVLRAVQGNFRLPNDFPTDVLAYLIGNNIITKKQDKLTYDFTEKGNKFLLAYSRQRPV